MREERRLERRPDERANDDHRQNANRRLFNLAGHRNLGRDDVVHLAVGEDGGAEQYNDARQRAERPDGRLPDMYDVVRGAERRPNCLLQWRLLDWRGCRRCRRFVGRCRRLFGKVGHHGVR